MKKLFVILMVGLLGFAAQAQTKKEVKFTDDLRIMMPSLLNYIHGDLRIRTFIESVSPAGITSGLGGYYLNIDGGSFQDIDLTISSITIGIEQYHNTTGKVVATGSITINNLNINNYQHEYNYWLYTYPNRIWLTPIGIQVR